MNPNDVRQFGSGIFKGKTRNENVDDARKTMLLHLISIVGIAALLSLGTVSLFNKCYDVAFIDYAVALLLFLNSLYMKKTGNYRFASVNGVSAIGTLFLYQFVTGGDSYSGYLWYITFPLFSLFLLGPRKGIYGTLIFFIPSLIYVIINPQIHGLMRYPPDFSIRIVSVFTVSAMFAYLMETTREKSHKKLMAKNVKLNEAIEELQRTEEKLREARERLESRVEERTRELSKVNRELVREIEERKQAEADRKKFEDNLLRAQKMEAVGTLAGGVAHDLNNILAGIIGYPDLILMELPEDSTIRKSVESIKKSGEKAAAIVEDLLTLSRRNVSVKENILIKNIINDYLESPEYEKLIEYHPNVRIKTSFSDPSGMITGSPVHISKTIMNLVSNAAEAMPDGGDIFISSETVEINKDNRKHPELGDGKYISLTVSDTGEGISKDDIKRIFEPFFSKKVMGRSGTGLGMAVVWGTVKDHDGIIDVKSTPGKGTTFTLWFPAVSGKKHHTVEIREDIIKDSLRGNGESILIVDDVKEQREVATDILTRLGYIVDSVPSGENGIEYLKSKNSDLILLDMIMRPGIDGLETYRAIKKFKPDQKVIITSGFSETDRVRKCLDMGAGAYVKKPFNMRKIGNSVKEVLAA